MRSKSRFWWQPVMTSSVDRLRKSSKHFLKLKLTLKKVMILFWWSAAYLITTSWIRKQTITPESMLSKLMRCWKLQGLQLAAECDQAQFYHTPRWPHRTTNASKIWMNWSSRIFVSIDIFTWPLANPTTHPQASWQLFLGKMLPCTHGITICFRWVHWIPKAQIFYATEKRNGPTVLNA